MCPDKKNISVTDFNLGINIIISIKVKNIIRNEIKTLSICSSESELIITIYQLSQ